MSHTQLKLVLKVALYCAKIIADAIRGHDHEFSFIEAKEMVEGKGRQHEKQAS